MYNIELMRKTLEYIEANPKEWDQGSYFATWHCGTTACFAGTALILNGDATVIDGDVVRHWRLGANGLVSAPQKATEILGLQSYDEADLIFGNMTDDIGELWRCVSDITDGELEVPVKYQL